MKFVEMIDVVGFIFSILVEVRSIVREKLERNRSLSDKIDDCLMRAIERWNAPEELKQSVRIEPIQYKSRLKEYLQHPEKGIHPLEKELLRLWAESIISDADCSAFVLSLKEDLIQTTQQEGFQKVLSELEELNAVQKDTYRIIEELWSRGGKSVIQLWDELSIFDNDRNLPYSIITSGRGCVADEIKCACSRAELVVLEAQSRLEAKAFTAAVILENEISFDNVIVVDSEDLYHQLVNDKNRKIIITSISMNHQLAIARGHSVVYCIGSQDIYTNAHFILPEISRDGFITALETSGLGYKKARQLALDSAKDINMLWRLLGINPSPPVWENKETITKFIPIMFVGRWDEMCDDDRQLIQEMTGYKSYDTFRREFNNFLYVDESPIKRIETVFAIKSPYALFKRYYKYVTDADIKQFLDFVDIVLEDVDPDAIAKMESQQLQYWREKRMFSSNLKRGVIEGVTLISIMQEYLHQDNTIKRWINEKFKSFDLQKYLSHRHNLIWMAEAAPRAFLQFIENDIANGSLILNELFIIRKEELSLTGTAIYYAELLRCLECIAWHEDYLPQVTRLLLHMCEYPNDSNWVNRPSNSLKNIYRFVLPGTLASVSKRISILKGLQQSYPEAVHSLCFDWLKGLHDTVWGNTAYFRWRWLAQKPENPTHALLYPEDTILREIYDMMMVDFPWTEMKVVDLLDLSMHKYMNSLRADIITALRIHIDKIKGNDTICDELRQEIFRHMEYPDTCWALGNDELQLYKDLLRDLTLQDIVNANKHYFKSIFMYNPEVGLSHLSDNQFERGVQLQVEIEERIIQERGLDGIWELVSVAKSVEAVANGFTGLTGDEYYKLVYTKYCDGELCVDFVKRYYSNLYNKYGSEAYMNYLADLQEINTDKIAVFLYAPTYRREFADVVERQLEIVSMEYWKNVQVLEFEDDDVLRITDKLLYYKRYWDLLHFITKKDVLNYIDNSTKGNILYSMFQSEEGVLTLIREGYLVAKILSSVDVTSDEDLELKVLQIEFYLYEHLEHYLKREHNHFQEAINTKPEMLMEIVCAIYKSDCDNEVPVSEEDKSFQQFKAHIAYKFWDKYHDIPCTNLDGEIDETLLRNYLKRIQELSRECNREKVLPLVLGKIFSNFQEGDDYPNELLCSLVEEYANDEIDSVIRCAIHNRRSFSTRSPFDGGGVERSHIATLQKYRDNAIVRSPRFVKILDDAIKGFEYDARRNDFEGKMNNFDF